LNQESEITISSNPTQNTEKIMRKLLPLTFSLSLLLLLSACSLVKLTRQGENVAILQSNEVAACTTVGTTTVSVLDKIAALNRSPSKVAQELRVLARNRSADRGDTLVAVGPPDDGEQTFTVYRCRR
jgi:hypothetical protein